MDTFGGVKAVVTDNRIEVYVSRESKLGKKLAEIGCKYFKDTGSFVIGDTYLTRYQEVLDALKAHDAIVKDIEEKKKLSVSKHAESSQDLKTGKYGNIFLFRPSMYSGFVLSLIKYDKGQADQIRKKGAFFVASTKTYHFPIEKEDIVRCLLEL